MDLSNKKWVAIRGDFRNSDDKIIFYGAKNTSIDHSNTLWPNNPSQDGILLFDDMMTSGSIEMDIEFQELELGEEAEIVFNYQNDAIFMCAGVTYNNAKFEYKVFSNGNWYYEGLSGYSTELPKKNYHIQVEFYGSVFLLYIDGIKVISSVLKIPLQRTNVGLRTVSRHGINLLNYKVNPHVAKVFVISQFGGEYDILYHDVIKPVCNNYGLDADRGDETVLDSLILNDIIISIQNAELIIVDITPDNPNVFYELGYAHALNKPTILLCEKNIREKLPFDISGFRIIFYDNSIGGKRVVENKLGEYIRKMINWLPIR